MWDWSFFLYGTISKKTRVHMRPWGYLLVLFEKEVGTKKRWLTWCFLKYSNKWMEVEFVGSKLTGCMHNLPVKHTNVEALGKKNSGCALWFLKRGFCYGVYEWLSSHPVIDRWFGGFGSKLLAKYLKRLEVAIQEGEYAFLVRSKTIFTRSVNYLVAS